MNKINFSNDDLNPTYLEMMMWDDGMMVDEIVVDDEIIK